MIKVVLFDIDNTLLSFDGAIKETLKEGFKFYNLKDYNDNDFYVFRRINDSLWQRLERKEITFEEIKGTRFNLLFKEIGISFDGVEFETLFRKKLFNSAIIIDGAFELLNYLKDKYILGVASNGPYKQQMNRLTISNMLNYFSYCFISEEIGYSKPSKEFYDILLKRIRCNINVNNEEIIVIGDSLTSDMIGAKNNNFKTIFYNPNKIDVSSSKLIDYEVKNLIDIKNIL